MAGRTKDEMKQNTAAAAGRTLPAVRFETKNMKSSYANVVNVTSTREEFTLLCGTNQSWHSKQKELIVDLTNRIILNPHAAKRLLLLMQRAVESYENVHGVIRLTEDKKASLKK